MQTKYIRIFLVIWGLTCSFIPAYTMLKYPIMKVTTPGAVSSIELKFIDKGSMNKEDIESYEFMKGWILGNDQWLRKSAKIRQYGVSFVGFLTAILCFVGAYFLPHLNLVRASF